MAAWAGLGYYSRARNLRRRRARGGGAGRLSRYRSGTARAARAGRLHRGGRGRDRLRPARGGGRCQCRAGGLAPVRDRRAAARRAQGDPRAGADAITPEERAGDFAQAMMDLGATICTPRDPRCLLCPLSAECAARRSGDPARYPVKAPKKPKPLRQGHGLLDRARRRGLAGPARREGDARRDARAARRRLVRARAMAAADRLVMPLASCATASRISIWNCRFSRTLASRLARANGGRSTGWTMPDCRPCSPRRRGWRWPR